MITANGTSTGPTRHSGGVRPSVYTLVAGVEVVFELCAGATIICGLDVEISGWDIASDNDDSEQFGVVVLLHLSEGGSTELLSLAIASFEAGAEVLSSSAVLKAGWFDPCCSRRRRMYSMAGGGSAGRGSLGLFTSGPVGGETHGMQPIGTKTCRWPDFFSVICLNHI